MKKIFILVLITSFFNLFAQSSNEQIHKVVIIGSGPAGFTAGMYCAKAKLDPILISGNLTGGQLTQTSKVENWPGCKSISGFELMDNMQEQAESSGCKIIYDEVLNVDFTNSPYKIFTAEGTVFKTESVIIATGSSYKKLGIPGEEKYWGCGVSTCTMCDAPLFKDKTVVVFGNKYALYKVESLLKYAKKVIIIERSSDIFFADVEKKQKIVSDTRVEVIYNSEIKEIFGDDSLVNGVVIQDFITEKVYKIYSDGVFLSLDLAPNSDIFLGQVDIDKNGYIIREDLSKTSQDGIFVAGNVADTKYKQAITAAAFGAMAAIDCQHFLCKKGLICKNMPVYE